MRLKYIFTLFLLGLIFANLVFADSPPEKILLVADAHYDYSNSDLLPYYNETLDSLGLNYSICTVPEGDDNGPGYDSGGSCGKQMKNYDAVVWFTGNDYGDPFFTLTSTDQTELAKYLDNGGKLFITGQDIGSSIGATDFYKYYLHAYYCKNDANDTSLSGASNDPIGDGTLLNISGGAKNQDKPSLIFYYEGGSIYDSSSFYYSTATKRTVAGEGRKYAVTCDNNVTLWSEFQFKLPGAIKADTGGPSGYKVVYLAFGFEGISEEYKRNRLMNRAIGYLSSPSTKRTKVYVRNLEDSGWEDLNITCNLTQDYCLRKKSPKFNGTCKTNQLFGNIHTASYQVNNLNSLNFSDDFNDGNLDGWVFSGDVDWINSLVSFEGDYSAGSGDINDSQISCMNKTLNLDTNSTLTFWWKVSSEKNYDYLKFYINGNKKDQISGLVDWTQKTYFLEQGQNNLSWCYEKDSSLSNYNDRGYLDLVEIHRVYTTDNSFNSSIEIVEGKIPDLTEGVYDFSLRCKDSDGYWGKFDNYSFEVDTTPPIFSGNGISLEEDYTNEENPNIEITVLTSYEPDYMAFSCNNQNWTKWFDYSPTYSNFNITDSDYGCNSTDGNRTIYVRIRDKAGNLGTDSGYSVLYPSDWIVLDRKSTAINQLSPQPNEWLNTTNLTFTFNFTDELSSQASCSLYVDGTLNQTNSSVSNNINTNFSVFGLSESQHTWNITCVDKAGNKNSSEQNFSVDVTSPTIDIDDPEKNEKASNIINLRTTISDSGSGVDKAWYKVVNRSNTSQVFDNGTLNSTNDWDSTWNSTVDISGKENITLFVSANDTLGNTRYNVSRNFTVDNSLPSVVINYPIKIYLNQNFNLSLTATATSGNNITFTSYNITNSTGDIVDNYTKTNSSIDQPKFSFTDFINVSNFPDGKYYISFIANQTNGNKGTDSSWFYIDRTPPNLTNWNLSIGNDTNYNETRIYNQTEIFFSVNVSEGIKQVDEVIATVVFPNTSTYNYSLAPENNNYTEDRWNFSFSPTQFGTYNITKIFANDTLGNVNITDVDIYFRVVKPSLELNFGQNKEIDADQNSSFNLTFNFNKTVSNQNLTLYIPNYYSNLTSWNCTNCSLAAGEQLNLTTNENITTIKLITNLSAGTPEIDTNSTWNLEFRDNNYTANTKIKTPFLNISALCNGNSNCTINQTEEFNLTVIVDNLQNDNHTGISYNTTLNFSCQMFSNSSFLGDVNPGGNKTASWTESFDEPGDYTCIFNVSEITGTYTQQLEKVIAVKDITPPTFLGRSWTLYDNFISDTNISINKSFNQNETIDFFVKARDNMEIESALIETFYNGNFTNRSLSLNESYTEYDIWKFTNKTDKLGVYNITKIYLNDSSGNLREINLTDYYEIIELKLNSSVANSTILINSTQVFYANVTGNATPVSEVRANIIEPDGETNVVTLSLQNSTYTGNYIPRESGNYSANITVILDSGINKTNHLNFFVPYGNISISAEDRILVGNTTYNLPIFITPEDGDLLDVFVNITVGNESIVNSTNKSKNLGNISWADYYQGRSVYFLINATSNRTTTINITAYSPTLNKSANEIINITVISNDTSPPDIHNFTVLYDLANLNEVNKFSINTTDNETSIKNVTVEITWPNNYTENLSASLEPNNLYELDFNGTNETGAYEFKIYSCDLRDNCVNETGEFDVTDNYNVLASISGTNKGDEVKFNISARNARGEKVDDFYLTLTVNNSERDTIVENSSQISYTTYLVKYDDPPEADYYTSLSENYTAYIFVEKNGNSGNMLKKFEVSENLDPEITSPDTSYYPANTPINLSVELKDSDGQIVKYGSVTAYCPDCSNNYARLEYDPSTKKYTGYNVFTSPSEDFDIFIYASSYFGSNKGYIARKYLIGEPPTKTTGETGGAGGGGAGGGAAPTGPNCTCSEWKDEGCGAGGCAFDQMYQTRTCSPVGCANETQCIFKPKCIPEKDFRISLSNQNVHVKQGKTTKVLLNLENIGEKPLKLAITMEKECCELNYTKFVRLGVDETTSLPINIHSQLSRETGEYLIDFSVKSGNLTKKVTLKIVVEKNPLLEEVEQIKEKLPGIEKEIGKLENLGIDVEHLLERAKRIEATLGKANQSILSDNLTALQEQVKIMREGIDYINLELLRLRIQKFLLENKWNILAGFIILLIISYFLSQVIIPYLKLKREIRMLSKEGENLLATRRSTEKQYFMRKIDEKAFRDILGKTQQQILKNRNEIKSKKEEKEQILKERVKPQAMLKWIFSLPISIPRGIKNRLKKKKEAKKKETEKKEERKRLLKGRSIEEILRERERKKEEREKEKKRGGKKEERKEKLEKTKREKEEQRREKEKKEKKKSKKSLTQRYREWKQKRREKQRREKLKKQRRKEEEREEKEREKQEKERKRKKQEEKRQKEEEIEKQRKKEEAERKEKEEEIEKTRKEEKERKEVEKKAKEKRREEERKEREEEKGKEKRRKEKQGIGIFTRLKEKLSFKSLRKSEDINKPLTLAELKIKDLKNKGKDTEELEREIDLIREDINMDLERIAWYRLRKLERKLEEI